MPSLPACPWRGAVELDLAGSEEPRYPTARAGQNVGPALRALGSRRTSDVLRIDLLRVAPRIACPSRGSGTRVPGPRVAAPASHGYRTEPIFLGTAQGLSSSGTPRGHGAVLGSWDGGWREH